MDREDHGIEPSVDESVSTVDHSGDNESSVLIPVPAARRSTRNRTQYHLHPDFVYDMLHTSESHESEQKNSRFRIAKKLSCYKA